MNQSSEAKVSPYDLVRAIGKRINADGGKTIDMMVGDPNHPTPACVENAYIQAIRRQFKNYTEQHGDEGLRKVLAQSFLTEGFRNIDEDNIFVSSGSKLIAFVLAFNYVDKGDQVVMPTPYYGPYKKQVEELDGEVLLVDGIDQMIESMHGDHVKVAMAITPNNPDGKMLQNYDIVRLIQSARPDQLIIIDEAYRDFAYASPFSSIGTRVNFSTQPNVAILRTISKSLAACGWRLGYSVTSKNLVERLKSFQAFAINPPSSPAQYAIREGLQSIGPEYYQQARQRYQERLSLLVKELGSHGVEATMPDGGLYLFLQLPPNIVGPGKRFRNGTEFTRQLAETTHVLTWSGVSFGYDNSIRLSVAQVDNEGIRLAAHHVGHTLHP